MFHPPLRSRRPHRLVLPFAIALLGATLAGAPTAGAEPVSHRPRYRPPVDAPVVDPFRPPSTPYGPGNRGLEYGTDAGVDVRAAAAGVVTFAGLVAGSRHVTVRHADGIRTTASYLDTVTVVVGQEVAQGQILGTTVGRLHFSARRGDGYLDPASLFDDAPPVVRLVPFDLPPGVGLGGERSAIRQLLGLGGDALDVVQDVAAAGGAAAAWTGEQGGQLVRTAAHYAVRFEPLLSTVHTVVVVADVLSTAYGMATRPCTKAGQPVLVRTGRHIAVLVAGLGSTSRTGSVDRVDTDALGYAPGDVLRFSYAGGRTRDATDALASVPASEYEEADTQQDLRRSGMRLADLLEEVLAAAPDAQADLIAHSQGGLVARLALVELERRHGRAWLDGIGLLATIGTPHRGADLATGLHAVNASPAGHLVLDRTVRGATGLDAGAPNIAQLGETSSLVRELARHPAPEGVPSVSIAARGDLVVPVPRARLAGAPEVIVPLVGASAHSALPGDPRTTRELALARAGAPPGCTSLAGALADQAVGAAIGEAEDGVGAAGSWLAAGFSLPTLLR